MEKLARVGSVAWFSARLIGRLRERMGLELGMEVVVARGTAKHSRSFLANRIPMQDADARGEPFP